MHLWQIEIFPKSKYTFYMTTRECKLIFYKPGRMNNEANCFAQVLEL